MAPRTPPDPLKHQAKLYRSLGFTVFQPAPDVPANDASHSPEAGEAPMDLFEDEQKEAAGAHASEGLKGRVLPKAQRAEALAEVAQRIEGCPLCRLCHSRTHTVPGEGNANADLVFVGEGPGQNEDLTGRPFVGKAGELLDKIIRAMQFTREDVWIGNVVKCRPPGNRKPEQDEMDTCLHYLEEQLGIIRPKAIVALGKTAVDGLFPELRKVSMTKLRGEWLKWHGIPVMPTFHPAYLLRVPTQKRAVWEDMQKVMELFGKAGK